MAYLARAQSTYLVIDALVWMVVVVCDGQRGLMLRYAGQNAFCCRKQKMAARCRQGAPCSFRDGLRLPAKKLPTGFWICSLSGSSVLRELGGNGGSVQSVVSSLPRPAILGRETLLGRS